MAGIQLAHAGRKASTYRPWDGRGAVPEAQGGWRKVVAPSALRFAEGYAVPEALTEDEIQGVITAFAEAARRACDAGFCVVEIHAAHGYLSHEFLSPFSNRRQDRYGGSFENRTRLVREVVSAVRSAWPERLPLFIRISATDWEPGGWDLEQSVELARQLEPLGVDLMDCSSGGNLPQAKIPSVLVTRRPSQNGSGARPESRPERSVSSRHPCRWITSSALARLILCCSLASS